MRQRGDGFPFVHGPVIVEEARPGAVSTWKETRANYSTRGRGRSEERSNPHAIPAVLGPRARARLF